MQYENPLLVENTVQDCVIYARYSSHAQRDVSIEQQVADCEAYARSNGLRVVKVYADRAISGTNDKRPQFQKMLKDAERGRWAYVLCWKVDRFARNRYDSATYKYRLKRHGVRVIYAKESIPDGPEGILLESVLEGSAEYYSANLSQNIKRGMRFNALECKVNNGSMPLGYCKGPDGRYAYGRTLVCLHVMGDRGLLAVERERVCLRRPERKVDLEQAGLMRQLRMFINGA